MSGQRVEYRVRWKREGRGQTTAIRQTWDSAYRKAQGILALEAVKEDTSFYAMPALEVGPIIESRPVGTWEATKGQAEVSDYAKKRMAAWAEYARPKEPVSNYGEF